MDQKKREAEFLAKLIETFKVEAEEHLSTLSSGLLSLEGNPETQKKQEILEVIYRDAHSLKGAARAVNHTLIQGICQSLENVLSAFKEGKVSLAKSQFDTLYASLELIKKFLHNPSAQASDGEKKQLDEMSNALEAIISRKNNEKTKESTSVSDPAPTNEPSQPLPAASTPTTIQHEKTPELEKSSEVQIKSEVKPIKIEPTHADASRPKTIRVSTSKLDQLLQQIEELLMVKLSTARRSQEISSLQSLFIDLEKKWSKSQEKLKEVKHQLNPTMADKKLISQIHSLMELMDWQYDHFKVLEDKVNRLSRSGAHDFRLTGSMVDSLLEDTKKLLLQPFATLLESFPLMIREISNSLGKEINMKIIGEEIELDRRILEEIKDPLIHLLRNSIDHGIEKPEDRKAKGKDPKGTLIIAITQVSGNSVEISISDDGKGMDAEKLKEVAEKKGVLSPTEIHKLSDKEALNLAFQFGLSTSPIITELSGRGLGLGIVAEKVEKLGGNISIETVKNQGTNFKITLPISLGTFRGIHIVAAENDFIIPTYNVKRVIRTEPSEIKTLEGRETILFENRSLSYVHLSQLLGLQVPKTDHKNLFVLVVKASETLIAIGVDEVLNEQEVLIKPLGKLLVRLKNISAATVMEGGKVIPILDPFDLVKSISQNGQVSMSTTQNEEKDAKKIRILIAEDSVTARTLLKNILESAGYDVKTSVDGAEAFSVLKTDEVDLLLTDLEMPRMNGFELTAKIRSNEKLKDLPVIICSSRGSKEDREMGIEVGANAYIDKSSFVQSNLLDIIQKLL